MNAMAASLALWEGHRNRVFFSPFGEKVNFQWKFIP